MSTSVGSIHYDLTLNTTGFETAQARVKSQMSGLSSSVDKVALTMVAVGAAFAIAGKAALNNASDYQQARIAFDTMLGSAEAGMKMMKELTAFAKRTPFTLPDVVQGAKSLLAYGIEAEKIIPTFNALGNIAAGVGRDKLPQLTLAYGQVRTATKLTGMELRQFTEAGVPLLDALAKQSGKSAAQIKADMEDGLAPSFEEVQKAIFGMSQKGGKFFNLMEKQSQTFAGRMSNIGDSVGTTIRGMLGIDVEGNVKPGSIFDRVSQAALKLMNFLEKNQGRIAASFEKMFNWIMNNYKEILRILAAILAAMVALKIVATITPFITTFFASISSGATIAGAAMTAMGGPVGLIVAAIAALIAILVYLQLKFKWFEKVKDYMSPITNKVLPPLVSAFKDLYNSIRELVTLLKTELAPVISFVQDHWEIFGPVIKGIIIYTIYPLIQAFYLLIGVIKLTSVYIDATIKIYNNFKNAIIDAKNAIINGFNQAKDAVSDFKKDVVEAWDKIKNKISENVDKIQNKLDTYKAKAESIQKTTSKAFDGGEGTTTFIGKIDAINEKLAGFINTTLGNWKTSATEGMKGVKTSIVEGWQGANTGTKEKLREIKESISNFVEGLPDKLKNIGRNIKKGFTDGFDGVKTDTKQFVKDFGKDFGKIDDKIKEKLGEFKDSLKNFWKNLKTDKDAKDSGEKHSDSFVEGAKKKMTAMETVRKVGDAILTMLALVILAIIVYVVDAGLRLGKKIIEGIGTAIGKGYEEIKKAMGKALAAVGDFMAGAWDWLYKHGKAIIEGAVRGIREKYWDVWHAVQSTMGAIGNFMAGVGGWLYGHGKALILGFASGVSSLYWHVWHAVQGTMGSIGHFMGGVGGWLWESGKALISGFVGGIYAMYWAPYNAIKDMLGRVRGLFPRSPAKEGPFSGKGWTLYSGMSLADGFADGISKNIGNVQSAANSMMDAASLGNISNSMNTALTGTMPLGPGANVSQETTTNNNIYGNITLGDTAAVDTFFNRLDRNGELARKGMATI